MSFKNKMGKMHRNEMTFFKKWAKFTHYMSHADTTTLMSTCHLFSPSINHLLLHMYADMHRCEVSPNGF